MRKIPKDSREGERPQQPESQLQTPDEFHADDMAELLEIAKSIAVELETSQKAPLGQ